MQPDQPSRSSRVSNGLLVVLVLLMAVWIAFTQTWPRLRPINTEPRAVTPRGDLTDLEKTTIEIFEQTAPAVVFITNFNMVRNIYSRQLQTRAQGSGTGFVWDEFGHIVTNLHVIQGADQLSVTLADETTLDAEFIGASSRHDLAVLRVEIPFGKQLAPIAVGQSSDLKVGQTVYAIGNPFGLDQTLTSGVISALHRDIQQSPTVVLRDMVQTDAAINPGNSGGPLLDSAGRLIGVNTSLISPSQANAGIGFAVPVDTVNTVVPQLIAHGREIRPQFGFTVRLMRYSRGRESGTVLRVTSVYPGSAADKAGLLGDRWDERGRRVIGDYLLTINGENVPNLQAFQQVMGQFEVGDTVTVRILRGESEMDVDVQLEATAPGG